MKTSIIFLGGCTLDRVWMVNNLPNGGLKSKAHKYFEVGGGMAANAAVAASRLGADTYFWGRAGNDTIGQSIKSELENYSINCQYFKLIDGAQSPVSAVIVDDNGERMIINHAGFQLSETPAWLPLHNIQEMQAVQVDTRWFEGAKILLKQAKRLNIPTILDAEKTPLHIFNEILVYTDYAIFSETGFINLIKDKYNIILDLKNKNNNNIDYIYENLRKILTDYKVKVVAVTQGKNGILWVEQLNSKNHYQAAFNVKVVDTTGAGDVFHGAFTFAIANKFNIKKAMEFASATSALKCMHAGGRSVPNLIAVQEFIQISTIA